MRSVLTCVAILALPWSMTASAQSPVIPIQGTLRTMDGELVEGTRMIRFGLYKVPVAGTPFFEVTKDVAFGAGQFVAYLGDGEMVPVDEFDGMPEVYLAIEIVAEGVEMSPRVRLGTSPFALYSQTCGEASVALAAQDVDCSGCVEGGDMSAGAFAVATYDVVNLTDGEFPQKLPQRCLNPVDAIYCALSHVSRSSMIQPDSGVSRYCDVSQVSPGKWQLCSRGGRPGEVPKTVLGCHMTCFSLQ